MVALVLTVTPYYTHAEPHYTTTDHYCTTILPITIPKQQIQLNLTQNHHYNNYETIIGSRTSCKELP